MRFFHGSIGIGPRGLRAECYYHEHPKYDGPWRGTRAEARRDLDRHYDKRHPDIAAFRLAYIRGEVD